MNKSHPQTSPDETPVHLLLIEDDVQLRTHLSEHFTRRGFALSSSERGDLGLQLASGQRFDLVLLDIMLPGLGGLDVLASLRREQGIPVILMSALGAEQDRISGFTQGADDYLPKPFSLAELDARVDALLRRVALDRRRWEPLPSAASDALQRDFVAQDVSAKGRAAGLTASEFRLLVTLQEHMGEPLSKAFLYQHVLHRGYTRLDRGLDVHVCNLRRKLTAIDVHDLSIQAVRNQGYVLVQVKADG
ncbi:response regulator transcription factor [Pseudomonas sp. NPDC089734]|uniref:response regulator transcription factor n=1 Tax=Pseudomonas sp. NPDC089734 TaxID=3364469 RepID=UPI0037FC712C